MTNTDQHQNYRSSRGTHNEFWRFEAGYSTGWDDAIIFLTFNGNGPSVSELGFRGEWLKRRVAEHAQARGSSANLWEFGKFHAPEEKPATECIFAST